MPAGYQQLLLMIARLSVALLVQLDDQSLNTANSSGLLGCMSSAYALELSDFVASPVADAEPEHCDGNE